MGEHHGETCLGRRNWARQPQFNIRVFWIIYLNIYIYRPRWTGRRRWRSIWGAPPSSRPGSETTRSRSTTMTTNTKLSWAHTSGNVSQETPHGKWIGRFWTEGNHSIQSPKHANCVSGKDFTSSESPTLLLSTTGRKSEPFAHISECLFSGKSRKWKCLTSCWGRLDHCLFLLICMTISLLYSPEDCGRTFATWNRLVEK